MTDLEQGIDAYNRGDYLTAFRLLNTPAVSTIHQAQFILGLMFENGQGVPQSYSEAWGWYGRAVIGEDAVALFKVGFMHYMGLYVAEDPVLAKPLFRQAAEKGHAEAQYYLGLLYENGKGVTKNLVEAHKWYNLAVSYGYENAIGSKNRVEKLMEPVQIIEAQRKALDWFYLYLKSIT